jgi:hypothetical protein
MRKLTRLWLAGIIFSTIATVPASIAKTDKVIEDIAGYRSWTRVNPAPLQVDFPSEAG